MLAAVAPARLKIVAIARGRPFAAYMAPMLSVVSSYPRHFAFAAVVTLAAAFISVRIALGASSALRITPPGLNFGRVVIGATRATGGPVPVTIVNSVRMAQPITITGISISGTDKNDFGIQDPQNCLGQVLQPGQSCAVDITFTPSGFGMRTGVLIVKDGSGKAATHVSLTGVGVRGVLLYKPRALSFGRVAVGSNKSMPVTLTNDNPVALSIDKIATHSGAFIASQDCIGELPPDGGVCPVSVTFSPTDARFPNGTGMNATLVLAGNSAGSPHKVRLSGIAFVSRHFGTLAPHAKLPTGAQCAQIIAESSFEPRPENATANHTVPTPAQLRSFHARPTFGRSIPRRDFATVNGKFTGTTDMILRWAACKWGIDEDVARAVAVNESNWSTYHAGDLATTQSQCSAGGWNGWTGSFCYQSYGIMQVRVFDYNAWPMARDSVPFNADFWGAHVRACMNGDDKPLGSETPSPGYPTYPNGNTDQMLWGCVGQWFSGDWYDSGALTYIGHVRTILGNKPWLGWWSSPSPNNVSISSPSDGATVSGLVSVTAEVGSSVSSTDFFVDGEFMGSGPPLSFHWDTTTNVLNGAHSISVDARDGTGAIIGHAFVNVMVSN
jgi:Bacterial Ig domain/Abnormal spindle-like microcephaly-assoc'd, ASPM-SPD-2-Hydin